MKHFDEQGNIIEQLPVDKINGESTEDKEEDKIVYKYFYRRKEGDV